MRQLSTLSPVRLTLASSATPFLDGFSTASAAFLISLIPDLTAIQIGLFTSLYLVGSFLGAAVIGPIADQWGRRIPYLTLMAVVFVALVVGGSVSTVFSLLMMRLLTGLALGGDYPVCQAMVSEQIDEKLRPKALSFLMLAWYFGALAGIAASVPIVRELLPYAFVLWVQCCIALIAFAARTKVPESAKWLIKHNNKAQGKKASSENAFRRTIHAIERHKKGFYFCAGFWLCQIIPSTIMMLYSPVILNEITGTEDAVAQMTLLYGFFLVGILPSGCDLILDRPRTIMAATFLLMALGLTGVAVFASHSLWITNVSFALFAIAYGLQSSLDFVYPNLIFNTEVRATLVGTITAITRIGAAGAAFVFPFLNDVFDIRWLFASGVAVLLLGVVIAVKFAPRKPAPDSLA